MRILVVGTLLLAGCLQPALAGDGALVRQLNGFLTLGGGYQALPDGGGGFGPTQNLLTNGDPTVCREEGQDAGGADCHQIATDSQPGQGRADGGLASLSGSLAFPLDYTSGLQIDAGSRLFDQRFSGEGALHLFWGEPGEGQAGPVLAYWSYDGARWLRTGGELQGYWGDFTGYLQGGYQWGEGSDATTVDDGFYLCGRGTWYADDDAALWLGGGYGPDSSALGFAGGEVRPFPAEAPAWSLVAEGSLGSDEQWSAVAGIRYHFGETQSLIERERAWLPLPATPCDTLGVHSGTDGTNANIWILEDQI